MMFEICGVCFRYLLLTSIALSAITLPGSAVMSEPRSGNISHLSGAEVATVTGKDVVHPTLSPDGKLLAYSEVLVQKGAENTSVTILNLQTKQKYTLIDDRTATKYKTYSAYVSQMSWLRADRLEVTISDGDVGSTTLTFDPQTRKLVSSKSTEGVDGVDYDKNEKRRTQLATRIGKIFPKIDRAVLTRVIQSDYEAIIIDDDRVLLHGKLFDREHNFWIVNLKTRSAQKLFKTGEPLIAAEVAGFDRVGKGSLFVVLQPKNSLPILFRDLNGKFQQIGQLKGLTKMSRPVRVVHDTSNRTILIGYAYDTYEIGNNPLYILEGDKLRRSTDFDRLYDVNVNVVGTRIAYCYWIAGKRQIIVRDLARIENSR
jgi:WD40 repeat protein